MHISLESINSNSIQACNEAEIQIKNQVYRHSVIVASRGEPMAWALNSLAELNESSLEPLLASKPEIVLIGHNTPSQFAPVMIRQRLSQERIGLESMSIGAACRTFNVLLNEGRSVVLGIVLPSP